MTNQFDAAAEFTRRNDGKENRCLIRRDTLKELTYTWVGSPSLANLAHDIGVK
jgi:hypothetical protein